MDKLVVMKPEDNVATCLTDLKSGEIATLNVDGTPLNLTVAADIPFGHKLALADIGTGENVVKYAETIGVASQSIAVGEHVHVHNVESIRARGDKA